MKKIFLCFATSCLVLAACGSKVSYSSLIEKLKSFSGEIQIHNFYENGAYSEEGFFTKDDTVILYLYGNTSDTDTHVYIYLPNGTKAPNNYYCLYNWRYFSSSYSESASFYISNNYSYSTTVKFDRFTGDSEMLQSSQRLAKSSIDLILTTLDIWLEDEYHFNLKDVGMFPRY